MNKVSYLAVYYPQSSFRSFVSDEFWWSISLHLDNALTSGGQSWLEFRICWYEYIASVRQTWNQQLSPGMLVSKAQSSLRANQSWKKMANWIIFYVSVHCPAHDLRIHKTNGLMLDIFNGLVGYARVWLSSLRALFYHPSACIREMVWDSNEFSLSAFWEDVMKWIPLCYAP